MLAYEVEHQDMEITLSCYLQKQNIGVGVTVNTLFSW